jgi:DNA (cytosine-5)-methyltransferase 1
MLETLFPEAVTAEPSLKAKRPKIGRYERLKRDSQADFDDEFKVFVDVNESSTPSQTYRFIDLFCGAGGITKGLSMASFQPVASVEISPIASATHLRNFPSCIHYCGDIKNYHPGKLLNGQRWPSLSRIFGCR